jgi:hypothetical protein
MGLKAYLDLCPAVIHRSICFYRYFHRPDQSVFARPRATRFHRRPAILQTDCFPYQLGRHTELASYDVVMVVVAMMTVVRLCKGSSR